MKLDPPPAQPATPHGHLPVQCVRDGVIILMEWQGAHGGVQVVTRSSQLSLNCIQLIGNEHVKAYSGYGLKSRSN